MKGFGAYQTTIRATTTSEEELSVKWKRMLEDGVGDVGLSEEI